MSAPNCPGGANTPSEIGSTPEIASAPQAWASATIRSQSGSITPSDPGISKYTAAVRSDSVPSSASRSRPPVAGSISTEPHVDVTVHPGGSQ